MEIDGFRGSFVFTYYFCSKDLLFYTGLVHVNLQLYLYYNSKQNVN